MPIDRKVNFLRSKGLTDPEIQVSLQNATSLCNQNQDSNVYNAVPPVRCTIEFEYLYNLTW